MEKRTDTDDFRVSQTGCTLLSLIRGPIAKHAVEAAAAMEAGMMRRDRLLDFAGPRALRNTRVPIPARPAQAPIHCGSPGYDRWPRSNRFHHIMSQLNNKNMYI